MDLSMIKLLTGGKVYIGDVRAYERYLLFTTIKSLDDLYLTSDLPASYDDSFELCFQSSQKGDLLEEHRHFGKCQSFVVANDGFFTSLSSEELLKLESQGARSEKNMEYLSFPQYSKKILGKNFKNPEDLKVADLSGSVAKEYSEAVETYFSDKRYSFEYALAYEPVVCERYALFTFPEGLQFDVYGDLFLTEDFFLHTLKLNFRRISNEK